MLNYLPESHINPRNMSYFQYASKSFVDYVKLQSTVVKMIILLQVPTMCLAFVCGNSPTVIHRAAERTLLWSA